MANQMIRVVEMEDLLLTLEHIGILIEHIILRAVVRLEDLLQILLRILTKIVQEPTEEKVEILTILTQAHIAVDRGHQAVVTLGLPVTHDQVLRKARLSHRVHPEVAVQKEEIKI